MKETSACHGDMPNARVAANLVPVRIVYRLHKTFRFRHEDVARRHCNTLAASTLRPRSTISRSGANSSISRAAWAPEPHGRTAMATSQDR
jgi:hypothetical protein